MNLSVNSRQVEVLRWIVDGCDPDRWTEGDFTYKLSAAALQNRGLARVSKAGGVWSVTATEAGRHYLETGTYPSGHRVSSLSAAVDEEPDISSITAASKSTAKPRERARRVIKRDYYQVDSPLKHRTRTATEPPEFAVDDPWESKVLVSVKEAAWTLSVSEDVIRDAVKDGDVERVYIGQGDTRYRIVYQSLLVWVNSLPTEGKRVW